MCIIYLSFEMHAEYPLILLANRDEFYDRPTAPAAYWKDAPNILAGRDLVGFGTWLGLAKGGRFSAVTNYRRPGDDRGSRSRGLLVSNFLRSELTPEEYINGIEKNAADFSGFNLLVGEYSPERREILYFSNRSPGIRKLQPGIYGLSNHLLDTPWPKVENGKSAFEQLITAAEPDREEMFRILADRTAADDKHLPDTGIGLEKERLLSSIFIETPVYGTRCSTVLTINQKFEAFFEERVFV